MINFIKKTVGTFILLVCVGYVLVLDSRLYASNQAIQESDIRAAVIVGIMRFTTWNNPVVNQNQLDVCYQGNISSKNSLIEISKKVTIKGKKIKLIQLVSNSSLSSCQVLLLGSKINKLPQLQSGLLTICDGCNQRLLATIITLNKNKNRVEFHVDINKAKSAKLSFSSDMLELATRLKGKS